MSTGPNNRLMGEAPLSLSLIIVFGLDSSLGTGWWRHFRPLYSSDVKSLYHISLKFLIVLKQIEKLSIFVVHSRIQTFLIVIVIF